MNPQQFYQKFPHFDWKFYTSNYQDLQQSEINTQEKAINHYHNSGQFESRRTHTVISHVERPTPVYAETILSIASQVYVSKALHMFEPRIQKKYSLSAYKDKALPCVFFGVYTDQDLEVIKNHSGLKLIIWGGEDANPKNLHSKATIREVLKATNCIHISISTCIYKRLIQMGIPNVYIKFNLVDKDLFKLIEKKILGKKIFIFNGQTKGRTSIYGEPIYSEVVKRLPQFQYIYSNELNAKYEEMPAIYRNCFIMLRLTDRDGNANSVQECQAMGIPVIHNQSEYGLKWKTVDDIINHINKLTNSI